MILVTGGAGYIGSHMTVKLLKANLPVIIFDNLSNSNPAVLNRITKLTGQSFEFIKGDIRDRKALRNLFQNYPINIVVHFAGVKAVGEAEAKPLKYYNNNVSGSVTLLEEMARALVRTIIFSSSATVYGDPGYNQYHEKTPLNPLNVYGKTKLTVENILRDLKRSEPLWRIAILRYFNPVGAHESGLLGEEPRGVPDNLMPLIAQVAMGNRSKLSIFGNDYPTLDGTGLRDYIHIEDLVEGHLAALNVLGEKDSFLTLNLGTGRPFSVFEMIKTFEKKSGKSVPYQIVERRAGDLAEYYADPTLAKIILGWKAQHGIERMCEDTWRWQLNNPNGYEPS